MATNPSKRTRSERVASLQIQPGIIQNGWKKLSQASTLQALGIAFVAVVIITVALQGWQPPFAYRQGYIPARAIVARVAFTMPDPTKTKVNRAQKAREVICYYENHRQPLSTLRDAVKNQLFSFLTVETYASLDAPQREALEKLLIKPSSIDDADITSEIAFAAIHVVFKDEAQRQKFDLIMRGVLDPIEELGLLASLDHIIDEGNQRWIRVFPTGQEKEIKTVEVERVRIAEVSSALRAKLRTEFHRELGSPEAEVVANLIHNFLAQNLPATLSYRSDLSETARQQAIDAVPESVFNYQAAISTLVAAGKPLTNNDLDILRAEYTSWTEKNLSVTDRVTRLASFIGMLLALFFLCGVFIHFHFDRSLLRNRAKLIRLLALVSLCILLGSVVARDPWQAEVIPVVLCAITSTIAYGRSLTLMLSTASCVGLTLGLGLELSELVVLVGASASTIMLLGRIRTRTTLAWVGVGAAIVTFLTTIGVGVMVGQSCGFIPGGPESGTAITGPLFGSKLLLESLFVSASLQAGYTLLACVTMAGLLLPPVERIFEVQTDLSLLELGDPTRPLLRQLAQRAPGTYNHSINVASIAEAAAEEIGAHGLLTRVGAYYHDIGKMFKPNYFVENQQQGTNCHDSLQPAMSTLVIIAHVKDGADLARKHRLPKSIIDFIEQHHGTTLVEYFYRQAAKRSEESPHGEEVSELNFRYPGPRPQFVEAAILMLADAVESACRSLVEPTPARIESLVEQIAMKRLLDGQFDECGLTLKQLGKVRKSLVKSMTAIYHGRIKYPDQQQSA